MQKLVLFFAGILAVALCAVADAQTTTLFTTTNDFSQWSGNGGSIVSADTNWSADTGTINGAGNTNASGAVGISGSLSITWTNAVGNYNEIAAPPGEGNNAAFLAAIDPGSSPSNTTVAYSGVLYMDYSLPPTTSGNYFQLGILLQYPGDGYYQTFFSSSTTDLGFKDNNGQEVYQATIPYNISAGTLVPSAFGFGIMFNSNYQPTNSFHIDDIYVSSPPPPPPVTSLFTTSNDFALFTSAGGDLIVATNDWIMTNATDAVNGIGNTNSPGAGGTAGSLLLYWSSLESSYGNIAAGPDEEFNAAFMQTIDPGCNPATETSVPAYGYFYMDYSLPDHAAGGSYFEVGVNLSYSGDSYFGAFFPSSTRDLGYQDNNGYEVYQATIPYSINAGNFYGFSLSVMVNSDYQPANGFHVDDLGVSAAQAPLITSVGLKGTSLIIQGTNGLSSDQFTVFTSTNLTLPPANWTIVGAPNTFYGPTFSNSITINPAATPRSFYRIQVP